MPFGAVSAVDQPDDPSQALVHVGADAGKNPCVESRRNFGAPVRKASVVLTRNRSAPSSFCGNIDHEV